MDIAISVLEAIAVGYAFSWAIYGSIRKAVADAFAAEEKRKRVSRDAAMAAVAEAMAELKKRAGGEP